MFVNFGNVEWFILSEVDVLPGAMSLGFVILGISVRMILSPRFLCFDARSGYGQLALFYILEPCDGILYGLWGLRQPCLKFSSSFVCCV